MKKILLTLVLMVGVVLGLFAQNLTYQAVIRDNNQQLVTNTAMKATVTITFATGTPATYVETVNATTNIHGLLTFEFGNASLLGRDFEGATITTTVKSADESTVYVDNLTHPVSAVPYALSVNGQSIQNYLTEHNYVDLDKLNDTLNAYSTTAAMDARHYLTSDSTVIGTMKSNIATNASNLTTLQGTLQQLTNQLNVQIAKLDSIAHIVDSLSKLPHGGGEVADGQPCPGAATVSDGTNTYNTVKIGDQCWMKENLRTTTKRNGVGNIYTENTKAGYNAETYGYYYDWAAVMQNESGDKVQGVCPTGWHVPSDAEWTQLTDYVKSKAEYKCGSADNYHIANALSSATGWTSPSSCGAGYSSTTLNKTGFSAVPAGNFAGRFYDFGDKTYFWSATQSDDDHAWSRYLRNFDPSEARSNSLKGSGFSVRCLKD